MRQSQLFTKTRREAPKDEVSKNASLLIRGGFIHKEMAGVYDFLPLGLRVLKKIEHIIRQRMNFIGGQEVLMSSLQRPELWEKTGRWESGDVDSWFKTRLQTDSDPDGEGTKELGLGFTHEEPITNMMEQFIPSYKDLPLYVYQFQTKFRNEKRARGGLIRTREFLMKDLYSFCRDQKEHDNYYEKVKEAYREIFKIVGLGDKTYLTFASGGSFSKYSHEFQTLAEAGEDLIYLAKKKNIAINKEVLNDDVLTDLDLKRDELVEARAIEVGNIFSLGDKFSRKLLCRFKDERGEFINPIMGSYGIGLGRLMGTVVEVLSDEKGIVWPTAISPFDIHLIELSGGNLKVSERAAYMAAELATRSLSVLHDDRNLRAGEKFADADLIGIPYQIILSEKGEADQTVEVRNRRTGQSRIMPEKELLLGRYSEFFD